MARYEQRLMDEHLEILDGETAELKHQFVDDNRMTFGQFTDKHNNYASREAALLLDAEFHLTGSQIVSQDHGKEVERKRAQKTDMRRCLYLEGFRLLCLSLYHKVGVLRWQGRIPLGLLARLVVPYFGGC